MAKQDQPPARNKRNRPRRRSLKDKEISHSQPAQSGQSVNEINAKNKNKNKNKNKKLLSSKPTFKPSSSSSFLDKMKAKLAGGHFRMINEKLYTCTGDEALNYFQEDPSLFNMYHTGYQEQMQHWPEQPVNIIIKWLRDQSSSLVVADFGCGEALLGQSVQNKVHSFDLVSKHPSVVACDMSKTPLDSSSVDVAVFCLSLMGINYSSYIKEAHRVLKPSGWLLIAEVRSRFDPGTGGADPNEFARAICNLGFTSVSKDSSNKMFILFYFKKKGKQSPASEAIEWPELKPCLYKRR